MAQAQNLLRQIAAERDALKAENGKLKDDISSRDKKIDLLNKKLDGTKKSLGNTHEAITKFQEANTALRDHLLEAQDKMKMLVDKYKELVASLRVVESERTKLESTVKNQTMEIKTCARKNLELYQSDRDLLAQYKNKSAWDALLQKEPVTQLKRVEIENIIESYRDKLDKNRYVDKSAKNEKLYKSN